ncbi:MAG TPA: DUF3892 domain-containing protein [Feifaniaceae bacterium]|nr:DUF3892 domain-containing protein [Feifaniaceae bacterium]
MKATKIRMKQGCFYSNDLTEIDEIYLTGSQTEMYYKKEVLHDYVQKNPNSIQVNIPPYPSLIPAVSKRREKYVRSMPNDSANDNLLRLPRE